MKNSQELIYLASPYSHPDESVRESNFRKVSKMAAYLVSQGKTVISPITYGHTLLNFKNMQTDWNFWSSFCANILFKCDKLIVYKMEGWDKSRGISEEISIANDHGIPVEYLEYSDNL